MGIKKFFPKKRFFIVLFAHIVVIIASYVLAFAIRFDFGPSPYHALIGKTLIVLLLIKLVVFHFFRFFTSSFRYASIYDLLQILKANTVSSVSFIGILVLAYPHVKVPRSIFLLDWGICVGLTMALRLAVRIFRGKIILKASPKDKNAIIIGAGEAGVMVLREYQSNPGVGTNIIAFIDDDKAKRNVRIHGIKVFGSRQAIPLVVERYNIEEIIIAMPSADGATIRDIISYCDMPNVKVKIVPELHKILSGDLEIKLREVKPEDLLGRQSVTIDKVEVGKYLEGKRVLITGAAGSIGSELCRQISSFAPREIVLFDINENDIYFLGLELKAKYPNVAFPVVMGNVSDVGLLKHVFSKHKPQIVFHAAAFKHVPLMEECPSAAVKNNVITTRNLIYASEHYGVESFVFISTDKAVNPSSVMGATKRIGEMVLQAKNTHSRTKFMAVRFGNVLGSKGSVVPLFRKQIEEGGPITVTHPDVKRYFMSISEAVLLVLQASAIGQGGEIFLLDMGEQIKIVDLAKDLISLSGLKLGEDIDIEFTGLRPGEKLYEELFLDVERDAATKHNKIYMTPPSKFDPKVLRTQIKNLERLANVMDESSVTEAIQKMIR